MEVLVTAVPFNVILVLAFQVLALAILASAKVPEVILLAGKLGISLAAKLDPAVTKPLES